MPGSPGGTTRVNVSFFYTHYTHLQTEDNNFEVFDCFKRHDLFRLPFIKHCTSTRTAKLVFSSYCVCSEIMLNYIMMKCGRRK